MNQLQIINPHFITFKGESLIIDILGGVDMEQVEKMICTLRISHGNYPPTRTTLDLYNDSQNDKLIRTLCDKYELQLLEVSKCLNLLITQLEEYRLSNLKNKTTYKRNEFSRNVCRQIRSVFTHKYLKMLCIILIVKNCKIKPY